jgi:hypothetical protein
MDSKGCARLRIGSRLTYTDALSASSASFLSASPDGKIQKTGIFTFCSLGSRLAFDGLLREFALERFRQPVWLSHPSAWLPLWMESFRAG